MFAINRSVTLPLPPAQPNVHVLTAYTAPLKPVVTLVASAPTPRKLVLFFVATGVLALVFWAVTAHNFAASASALHVLGKDTAPSIIAASRIGASLADAHANAARALLSEGDAAGDYWQRYEVNLNVASEQLVGAAQNITYGEEERAPILRIAQNLRAYSSLIGQARGTSGYERAAVLQQANALLHSELLPAAEALDAANLKHLNAQYASREGCSHWETVSTVLAGLALLGVLLWTQSFLLRRFRRVLNLPLLLATLLLGWHVFFIGVVFMNVHEDLRRAREDAFDSIYCMRKARVAACDAHADQALYVLTQNRSDYGLAHALRMSELVNAEITDATVALYEHGMAPEVHLGGLLIRAARNETFAGERDAVNATLHGYCHYDDAWNQIRALEDADRHGDAVKLCLDDTAFLQFDRGIEMVIALNQREFDHAIDDGVVSLECLPAITGAITLGVVALTWLGLRPRWNEYRV